MTTFNDLLGITQNDTVSTVKMRYKLLSSRVHPDKGGSKILMQLVQQAYENASKGKGNNQLTLPASVSIKRDGAFERDLQQLKTELHQVKTERDELSTLNQLLKVQLSRYLKTQNVQDCSLKNTNFERKIAQLEGEMVLLKEGRSQFLLQKDMAQAEHKKIAGELRRALSDNEILETELERNKGYKCTGAWRWAKKFWFPALIVFVLSTAVVFGMKNVNWTFFTHWFSEALIEKELPIFRVVDTKVKIDEKVEKLEVKFDNINAVEQSKSMPFLRLTEKSGIWLLASYTVSNQPYIAIRSNEGSYVVNDCSGDFTLYLNKQLKPLRVAANLIYLHQNQHFHVYNIPYGQGATSQSWFQSRKLRINEEDFTSEKFRVSRIALTNICNKG